MLKSTLITAATALAITAGVFGVSSASADSYDRGATVRVDQRGAQNDGWRNDRRQDDRQGDRWNNNRGRGDRHVRGPARICKPVVRNVKVRGRHGWHFERIVVGERCHFVQRGW